MRYSFAGLSLDPDRVELMRGEVPVPLEPQVFSLLLLLVENHDRMVSRDEIVEKIWNGRAISDSALSSRVKSLRSAIGDDGARQEVIRTLRGRGFRCVAEVRIASPAAPRIEPPAPEPAPATPDRPTVAVLPFAGGGDDPGSMAEGLPQEILIALAQSRDFLVISRASSFRFRERDPDIAAVGRALGARYCVTGTAQVLAGRLLATAELAATASGEVLWSRRFEAPLGPEAIESVTAEVANAVETHITVAEVRRARHWPEMALDAWSAFHLGLSQMYRFNRADNAAAARHFQQSLARAEDFARAHAGLSFTAFQDVYAGYAQGSARRDAMQAARRHGEHAVEADPLDPFAAFNLGRAYWLEGELAASRDPLDRALHLSPSFAKGFYARAMVHAMEGETEAARAKLDRAIALSPLDPFLYAFRGTKALTYAIDGRPEIGLPLIDAAGASPVANPVVGLIAAGLHQLAGDGPRARAWIARVAAAVPGVTREAFLQATPFVEPGLRQRLHAALGAAGLR